MPHPSVWQFGLIKRLCWPKEFRGISTESTFPIDQLSRYKLRCIVSRLTKEMLWRRQSNCRLFLLFLRRHIWKGWLGRIRAAWHSADHQDLISNFLFNLYIISGKQHLEFSSLTNLQIKYFSSHSWTGQENKPSPAQTGRPSYNTKEQGTKCHGRSRYPGNATRVLQNFQF